MKLQWQQTEYKGELEKHWIAHPTKRCAITIEPYKGGLEVSVWIKQDRAKSTQRGSLSTMR